MNKKHLFNRRQTLLLGLGSIVSMSTLALGSTLKPQQASNHQKRNFAASGNLPLARRAAAKGLIYGAAVRKYALSSDAQLAARFTRECAMLVPEWELKWNFLRPKPNTFNFAPADWLAAFAQTHRMLFRGHTLVWHEPHALPEWFSIVNSQNARQILLEHIATVVGHYAGKIHSWDVVNEAISVKDGRSDGLRETPWLKFLGSDYIELAFRAAAKADPKALLVYNDYGLDYDTPEADAKRTAVLKLLKRLKSRGTPIHALGIQAHLSASETRFNPQKLQKFLSDVASLGLKILISELDVKDKELPVNINIRDRLVAATYEDYLSVVLDEPAVTAVITWGLSDRYTWISEFEARPDSLPVRPLPLDADINRKLAWNAIARAFDQAPKR
ncbi:endo-1,4-beta-xylanase (plasmid) [Nostoc sp. UHCC 0302]|uniref:endo-1,4-beta-xylanase n=1 Tax=Nostoc sp. UHCC 0302 TaxID=3134896 RepID=UPI00311C8DB2